MVQLPLHKEADGDAVSSHVDKEILPEHPHSDARQRFVAAGGDKSQQVSSDSLGMSVFVGFRSGLQDLMSPKEGICCLKSLKGHSSSSSPS